VRKEVDEEGKRKPKVIDFEPENPGEVNEPPKYGKEDNKQHSGGNTWAGGTVSLMSGLEHALLCDHSGQRSLCADCIGV
jgi:hypothetical protein